MTSMNTETDRAKIALHEQENRIIVNEVPKVIAKLEASVRTAMNNFVEHNTRGGHGVSNVIVARLQYEWLT